jgi:hypothetical protein
MVLRKILQNILWFILVIVFAFFALLYSGIKKEVNKNDFHISSKKFEYRAELDDRNIDTSIIRAKEALTEDIYDAGNPFKKVSFEKAWETSSPSFLKYITHKKSSIYSNTSHEFLLQTLGILYDLMIAHRQTKNDKFLIKGYYIIEQWYKQNNRFYPFQSPLVWNGHTTSERILAILSFNNYASQFLKLNNKKKELINQIGQDSILFLSNSYNYNPKHNHGIYEDFALMIAASHLHNIELQKKYYSLAIKRFQNQVLQTIDKNGVHLENSPKYHLIIADLLSDFVKYATTLNITINNEVIRRVKLATKNKYFFVLNNGYIPPVGDSPYVPYNNFIKVNNSILVSQDGGYIIYKDDNFYFLLRSQSISHVHAHEDKLSYIYEENKHLIASDPGFLDYSSAKQNIFLHSLQAHNTIYIQNNKIKKRYSFIYILNNKQLFYCHAVSLDKNISREILLDKKLKILLVHDNIHIDENKKIFEILNLSRDVLSVQNKGKSQELSMKDNQRYYITSFQKNGTISKNILHGTKKPYFGGWRAVTYKNLVPSYALWTRLMEKKDILFDNIISKTPVNDFFASNSLIRLSLNGTQYKYNLDKIRKQAEQIKKSDVLSVVTPKSNYIIKKLKKKLAPLFYKRIRIFIYEAFLILLLLLLSILIKNKYTKLLFWGTCTVIVLFDILVFINT